MSNRLRHSSRRLRGLAVVVALGGASLALAAEPAVPELPAGEGQDLVSRTCSGCHSLDNVVRMRLTRAQWEAKVDEMIARGAFISDEEAETIVRYLSLHFGP